MNDLLGEVFKAQGGIDYFTDVLKGDLS